MRRTSSVSESAMCRFFGGENPDFTCRLRGGKQVGILSIAHDCASLFERNQKPADLFGRPSWKQLCAIDSQMAGCSRKKMCR